MKQKEHLIVNIILAGILVFSFNWFDYLIPIALGLFIGTLAPDFIEPAKHWTHRKKFHSWDVLIWTSILFAIFGLINLIFKNDILFFIEFFFLGYAGHLLADSTTKMSLPKWDDSHNTTKKELPSPIKSKTSDKKFNCGKCGRAIKSKGNCWPCNTKIKKARIK